MDRIWIPKQVTGHGVTVAPGLQGLQQHGQGLVVVSQVLLRLGPSSPAKAKWGDDPLVHSGIPRRQHLYIYIYVCVCVICIYIYKCGVVRFSKDLKPLGC